MKLRSAFSMGALLLASIPVAPKTHASNIVHIGDSGLCGHKTLLKNPDTGLPYIDPDTGQTAIFWVIDPCPDGITPAPPPYSIDVQNGMCVMPGTADSDQPIVVPCYIIVETFNWH